ncbi:tRNA (adenosine(37)-N6)-threonylcarbamoyltransferase complex transferase subunit TsaD [Sulfurospirillum deleyianum]|uniref:tRNA N6-adenosine threonylcarbamoyltransferase n=1 Tax=Sulfurospirillum deleyianum (strain ATCC 51133 / DSM 6946 / 5175) TaxID=525898 RepID=D1B582_SULD5|nr:tRNA (adenosine(37)-N6)-threonylcarbamoyltransferase complex transferase subunit TsaD [Sulfurospirillum deleyianum]ACZ13252.1 metalloendopeptidase, glycoprotease family [Sulfurospirillum deleyianum DSM 6946]
MILSIESSCDDSSIAITRIEDKKLLFHKKISQDEEHAKYGGVVPELAARLHAITLPKILEETQPYFEALKAIAVTNEPGLSVSLVEGVSMAKALSVALHLPLLGINHLKGHICSLFIEEETRFPMDVLLVSGGHTQLLHVKSLEQIELLATTMDDSFGESFDKVGKMLGLPYPAGAIIETYAQKGDAKCFDFTIPLQGTSSSMLAFSYSGLKNQVRLCIEAQERMDEQILCDICASFQRVAVAHLMQKIKKAYQARKVEHFGVVGGASANLYLRGELERFCASKKAQLYTAKMAFCSDNAAMIGRCGVEAYQKGVFVSLEELKVRSSSKDIFYM